MSRSHIYISTKLSYSKTFSHRSRRRPAMRVCQETRTYELLVKYSCCVINFVLSILQSSSKSFFDPHSSHAHPCTNAHTCNANLLPGPPKLSEQRRHLPRASATEWVPKRNCTSIWIDLDKRSALLVQLFRQLNVPSFHPSPAPLHTIHTDSQRPR